QGSHDADAAALMGMVAAARGKLSRPAQRCQRAAAEGVHAFTIARLRLLQRCKRRPPADLLPGSECATVPDVVTRVERLGAAATRKIGARCKGSVLAEVQFGPPCAGPDTAEHLAQCLLAAATTAGDDALAAEFHWGFCGDAGAAVEKRIDALLAQMTLDEKLAQMHGTGFSLSAAARTAANDRLHIPGLAMIDGPRGVGAIVGHATAFPVGSARGATWDPALEERVGEAVGTEARAKGASMILAPTINILRHPRWGRAQETYGEDTFHLGRMATGYVRGAQGHVIANPKHFAANTIENTRFNVDVSVDERTLREVYLPHFRMAVQDGHAASVMSAYNLVNGQYCGENTHLLHDVLKGDWGFQGFVESDWFLGTRSTVPSALAGRRLEMPQAGYYGKPPADAVAAGQVPQATIDEAVRRILRAQLCSRLDTDPPQVDPTQVETQAHTDLALEVAREGIVVLRNEGAVLPL